VQRLPHFIWEFIKSLDAYLLPYEDLHIAMVTWLDIFEIVIAFFI
jgi:hypothetical protein